MGRTGEQAPAFTLDSTSGDAVTATDVVEDGPAILLFNRGHWCSFCIEQLRTYEAVAESLRDKFATTVHPILGDPLDELAEMRSKHGFSFELLSDSDLTVSRTYTGVEDNDAYGAIPIPGTFILDGEGIIRYEHVATRPDDRTYGNFARYFIKKGFEDPYPGTYPDPY